MSRISDMILKVGDAQAQRELARGQGRVSTIGALAQLPGAIARDRAGRQAAIEDQRDRALDRQYKTAQMGEIESRGRERDQQALTEQQARELAAKTHTVNEWLSDIASNSDLELQKAAYEAGRPRLVAAGILTDADAPKFWPGMSWVKSRLSMSLPAAERFKQMFPDVKPAEGFTLGEGQSRFNADGSQIAAVPKPPAKVEPEDLVQVVENGRPIWKPKSQAAGMPVYHPPTGQGPQPDFEWVTRNGQPTQIRKGTAQPGDRPYDATAERGAADKARSMETQVAKANDALQLIDSLVTFDDKGNVKSQHPGFDAAFGSVQAWLPTVRQDTADAKAKIARLVSMVTQPEMQSLRGLGPASDRDVAIIQAGATTLANPSISESQARQEIQRIRGAFNRLKALGAAVAQPPAQPVNSPAPAPGRGAGAGPQRVGRFEVVAH